MNGNKPNVSYDFPRPAKVPAEAIFVGGSDGGIFLKSVRHEKYSTVYLCQVYNFLTGNIEVEGAFTVVEPGNSEVDLGNSDLFDSWDGDCIYLQDGRQLKQISLTDYIKTKAVK